MLLVQPTSRILIGIHVCSTPLFAPSHTHDVTPGLNAQHLVSLTQHLQVVRSLLIYSYGICDSLHSCPFLQDDTGHSTIQLISTTCVADFLLPSLLRTINGCQNTNLHGYRKRTFKAMKFKIKTNASYCVLHHVSVSVSNFQ